MPFVPAQRLVTEFRASFNKSEDHMIFYFKAELKYFCSGQCFTAYNTETKTPGYTLFNLGIERML
jgi:iron complex outermembrane receptor protein